MRARPPLTGVLPRTPGDAPLKLVRAAAHEIIVDRHAQTSDLAREGRG